MSNSDIGYPSWRCILLAWITCDWSLDTVFHNNSPFMVLGLFGFKKRPTPIEKINNHAKIRPLDQFCIFQLAQSKFVANLLYQRMLIKRYSNNSISGCTQLAHDKKWSDWGTMHALDARILEEIRTANSLHNKPCFIKSH
jgi:hypothetical protein